jgi:hypothetical protein
MSIYIARSPDIAARALDGEMIVMSLADSSLFTLSEVATEIWSAADGRTPLDEIVRQHICRKFEVEPDVAYRDAEEYCHALARHGILVISDQPIDPAPPAAA